MNSTNRSKKTHFRPWKFFVFSLLIGGGAKVESVALQSWVYHLESCRNILIVLETKPFHLNTVLMSRRRCVRKADSKATSRSKSVRICFLCKLKTWYAVAAIIGTLTMKWNDRNNFISITTREFSEMTALWKVQHLQSFVTNRRLT